MYLTQIGTGLVWKNGRTNGLAYFDSQSVMKLKKVFLAFPLVVNVIKLFWSCLDVGCNKLECFSMTISVSELYKNYIIFKWNNLLNR